MLRCLKQILTFHWTVTILLMAVFGLLFGLVSLNIISLLHTNFSLIAKHGAMALMDGALIQLLQLLGYGFLSLIFWLLFKACEHVLVDKMTH